jgi:hypothetical protein
MGDKVEQLQADIERGVAELVEGEDWRRWLQVAARFPRYSFRNTLLIRMQRPDATAVMGYRAWQALGHQVRKGEQSISILAPWTYKASNDKKKSNDDEDQDQDHTEHASQKGSPRRVLRGFRIAHVFDPLSRDLTHGISGNWRWRNWSGDTTTVEPLLGQVSRSALAEAEAHLVNSGCDEDRCRILNVERASPGDSEG